MREHVSLLRLHRFLLCAVVALACYGLAVGDEGSKPRKKDEGKPEQKQPAKPEKADKPEKKPENKTEKPEPKPEKKVDKKPEKVAAKETEHAPILKAIDAFGDAFNSHNAAKTAACWASDAIYTDRSSGDRITGREDIQAAYADIFKRRPKVELSATIHSIRMITADVAQVEATVTVRDKGDDDAVATDFSAIFKQVKGTWLLDSGVETELDHAATIQDNLEELDWLVGEWHDEGTTDGLKVRNVFRWNSKRTFLIRSYHVEEGDEVVRQGTQIIGWDPVNERIRSWIFGSEGGFGEGFWVSEEDGWLATLSGTMPDGSSAIVTQVFKKTGENSMTSQLVGAEIDGELQPAKPVVKMKRIVTEESK
ncbi:YybH family protein [Anatilimnocola floriformis]|uniref:YybH family protein n=1 Tax=Anatilimnocola floriformis TaxID=2948575 RepID=UPI0020C2E19C|nr:nuclear transport factor 2 family protein [Anatilimnocola floriformis]